MHFNTLHLLTGSVPQAFAKDFLGARPPIFGERGLSIVKLVEIGGWANVGGKDIPIWGGGRTF